METPMKTPMKTMAQRVAHKEVSAEELLENAYPGFFDSQEQ